MEYSFTLKLNGISEFTEAMENSLYEAGCDDALLCSRDGSAYIDFNREADSMSAAIESALSDVKRANIVEVVTVTVTN